ncbi:alpha/beta hydrolase [Caenimonas sedimenti]|uniref:Alpha/beta hydrolase n=1 Tax=Caenimonas sedimenti TaxID=2596921 RepID=A0A562ZK48_9BURK|nr:alpha/beta hydrolase [Caenimonas sedimenti]TWO68685.1 alpha/beta hydrolase [Caenimonas sedimenti]
MSKQDGAWHDSMYNNRARVADTADYLARWAAASAQARTDLPCKLDIAYGGEPGETLDVFPGATSGAPVLVFIHGGYWRALDKRDHSFVAPPFTAAGACVVVPNYALAPAVTIPQITLQMVRAVAWTCANIAPFGGDPRRITVAGHSAGGQLATMMLACQWKRHDQALPVDVVRSALAISALHDLEPIMKSPFLQGDLKLTPQQVAQASPARLPAPPHGTLYTVTGGDESEEYIRQNRLIQQAWGAERVPVCEPVLGRNHFSVLDALVTPGERLHQLALQLLRA